MSNLKQIPERTSFEAPPSNRMDKPSKREPSAEAAPAAPIALPGKVTPFVARCCGKGQSPIVRRTFPEKGYAEVTCGACGHKLRFFYANATRHMPWHEVAGV